MESIASRLSTLPDLHYPHTLTLPSPSSRKSHLLSLISTDPSIFLERYGHLLTLQELQTLTLALNTLPYDYSTQYHLSRLNDLLDPNPNVVRLRSVAIKNRRRAYLEKLVQNGDYFSEEAMREREPYLHYEMVGRYQDPIGRMMSRPGEKWSETLMRRCEEVKIVEKIRGEQRMRGVDKREWVGGGDEEEEEEEMEEVESEEEESEVVKDRSKDTEEIRDEEPNGSKPFEPSVSVEEMQDQLDQFTNIMQQKFLSGKDTEHLDYSKIDEDERLDDYWFKEASLDAEEKYFDED